MPACSCRKPAAPQAWPTSRRVRRWCSRYRGRALLCRLAARRRRPRRRCCLVRRCERRCAGPRPRCRQARGSTNRASPCCRSKGDRDLVLAARADAVFVHDLVRDALLAARRHAGGQHGFVFGKRLLREERAREVEVTSRPRGVVAERPEILDGPLDLLDRQRVAELRHVPIERANRSTLVDHRHPVRERLDRVGRAIGEVRQLVAVGDRETDDAAR